MLRTTREYSASLLLAFVLAGPADAQTITVVDTGGTAIPLYQHSYALVIGASKYTAGWPSLPGVTTDLVSIQSALHRHGFEVTLVTDPTTEQLSEAFRTFISSKGLAIENRLLVYFAGHGHTIRQSYGEEMGYVVPSDAPLPSRDLEGFLARALPMQQIEVYAKQIQSKHALFLFDACFSGSLFSISRSVPEHISYKTQSPVRQFITSGSADESVPDISIFCKALIAGIDGQADLNRDGYVVGTELGEYLQERVVNYSYGAQHPQYGKIRNPNLDKGDFVFISQQESPATALRTESPTTSQSTPAPPVSLGRKNNFLTAFGVHGSNISGAGLAARFTLGTATDIQTSAGLVQFRKELDWAVGSEVLYRLARFGPLDVPIGAAAGVYGGEGRTTNLRLGIGLGLEYRLLPSAIDSYFLIVARLYYPAWYTLSETVGFGGALSLLLVL